MSGNFPSNNIPFDDNTLMEFLNFLSVPTNEVNFLDQETDKEFEQISEVIDEGIIALPRDLETNNQTLHFNYDSSIVPFQKTLSLLSIYVKTNNLCRKEDFDYLISNISELISSITVFDKQGYDHVNSILTELSLSSTVYNYLNSISRTNSIVGVMVNPSILSSIYFKGSLISEEIKVFIFQIKLKI